MPKVLKSARKTKQVRASASLSQPCGLIYRMRNQQSHNTHNMRPRRGSVTTWQLSKQAYSKWDSRRRKQLQISARSQLLESQETARAKSSRMLASFIGAPTKLVGTWDTSWGISDDGCEVRAWLVGIPSSPSTDMSMAVDIV
eukprot:1120462-Amphidinium_carterae.2